MLTKTDDTAPHTHKKADAVIFARIQTRKIFYRCFFSFFFRDTHNIIPVTWRTINKKILGVPSTLVPETTKNTQRVPQFQKHKK